MSTEPEQGLLASILPAGILECFTISKYKQHPDSCDIYLEEKNFSPEEYKGQKLIPKGFFEPTTVQDYPIRGKAVFLKARRRRRLNTDIGLVVHRDWDLVAKGTRLTQEFAAFLSH